ncbi:MAG: aspartate aminotransferase family protein [Hyphomicrobiales bacterium]
MTAVMPTYARADLVFESGEGAWLTTASGERYLDMGAGVAVTSLGHAHPALVEALREQAGKLWHCSNLYRIAGQERLAARLASLSFAGKVFFSNSGAEACEAAIKIARKYHSASGHPERYRIITFEGAFHGRTLATIAAGGQAKHLDGFGPRVDGFDQAPLNDLDAVKALVGDDTAAIMIEPVQGEGGVRQADPAFLRALRDLCDERGLLLVFDEVQTGMGRTGKLFAYEWSGVKPDVMALAKGIAGGFPLGACLATDEAAKGMTAGTHGSTFGGNPLAMAAANATLDIIAEPAFLERVRRAGLRLKQKLAAIRDENSGLIEEVRGEGLMIGLRMRVPNTELVSALLAEHVLTVPAGDNVVRLIPPLVVSDEEIDLACEKLSAACARLRRAADAN